MIARRLVFLTFLAIAAPASLRAEPVCVTSEKAILRKGPGTQFPVTWTVGQYMPFLRVSQKSGWTQVEDLDGAKHWVSSSNVSTRISCVVVRSKTAPLRQGPGPKTPSAEIAFADRYTPFKKLNRDGAWIELQDNFKGKFWIYETNVWIPVIKSKISF